MGLGPYFELKRIEQLARIADQIDPGENDPIAPAGWGPASFWRIGLAVFAVLIACLLIYRLIF